MDCPLTNLIFQSESDDIQAENHMDEDEVEAAPKAVELDLWDVPVHASSGQVGVRVGWDSNEGECVCLEGGCMSTHRGNSEPYLCR